MKTTYVVTAALLSTILTPTAALAAPVLPSVNQNADSAPVTATDMQSYCDGQYVTDSSKQRTNVTGDSAVADSSTPTGDTQNINYRPDTTSSYVLSQFLRPGDPLSRRGGSVNMWGNSLFGQKTWDNTLYDTQTRYEHYVRYNWTCHVDHWQVVGSHPETTPGTPPQGYYTNPGTIPSNGQGSCQGVGPDNPHWGTSFGACVWHQTAPGTPETTVMVDDYDWASFGDFAAAEVTHGPISDGYYTTETDIQQSGHVDSVNYTETGEFLAEGVYTLACINPGKKGGTWTPKNGYTGGNCNTVYFNAAPTSFGTTFDTINGVLPSASLPH